MDKLFALDSKESREPEQSSWTSVDGCRARRRLYIYSLIPRRPTSKLAPLPCVSIQWQNPNPNTIRRGPTKDPLSLSGAAIGSSTKNGHQRANHRPWAIPKFALAAPAWHPAQKAVDAYILAIPVPLL